MRYKTQIDPNLSWFDLKNYLYLDELNCNEFYYELEMRSELIRSNKGTDKKNRFWFDHLITNKDPNVSQYGHDWRLLHCESVYNRAPNFSSRSKYPKLKSTDLFRPLSTYDLEALLEDIPGIAMTELEILKQEYGENCSHIPINLILKKANINNEPLYAGINLHFSDEKILNSLKKLLPVWREELNLSIPKSSKNSNSALKNKLRDYYAKKLIPLVDIVFFYKFKGLPVPKASTLYKILNFREFDERNFIKTIYPKYIEEIKNPYMIKDIHQMVLIEDLSETSISDL